MAAARAITGQDRCLPPPMMLDSLVAVSVFLTGHMTIVRQVAFGKVLADIVIVLDVIGSQIAVPLRIDGLKSGCTAGARCTSSLLVSAE